MSDQLTKHGWDAWAEYEGEFAYRETIADGCTAEGAEIERKDAIQNIRDYEADPLERDDSYQLLLANWKSTLLSHDLMQYFVVKPEE